MKQEISEYYKEKGYCVVYIGINKEPRRVATLRKPNKEMHSMSYAKYLYTSYVLKDVTMYDRGDYEQMIQLLKDSAGKEVGVCLKYKKDKLIDFTLNLESLVQIYGDERFLELERIGWGINDKSCKK